MEADCSKAQKLCSETRGAGGQHCQACVKWVKLNVLNIKANIAVPKARPHSDVLCRAQESH